MLFPNITRELLINTLIAVLMVGGTCVAISSILSHFHKQPKVDDYDENFHGGL